MNRRVKNNVTIRDVAKAAGVSVSTVSRVLNDKDDVSFETGERVKDVIQELGYTASLAARSMRSRKTGVIGLIMPDVEQAFPVEVMKGVNRAIAAMTYLIELGHCRIGFIGGHPDLQSANRRLEGYQDSLRQAGIAIDPSLILPGDVTLARVSL